MVKNYFLFHVVVLSTVVASPLESSKQSSQPVNSSPTVTAEGSVPALPSANDSFETVRRGHKVYVDKTPILEHLLLEEGVRLFYFTRPKKFGKTMFLQMVQKFFLGEADLFENLKIHDRGNVEGIVDHHGRNETWIKYPVVYLDFTRSNFCSVSTLDDFRRNFNDELERQASAFGVHDLKKVGIRSLIQRLRDKFRLPVIILIDDFDAPIHHAFLAKNNELAKGMHSIFLDMFSTIKNARAAEEIELAFVTGISRFGTYTRNSGADNFVDLTDSDEFATALGFTAEEVDAHFKPHIAKLAASNHTTPEEIMQELRKWYGGYRFSSQEEFTLLNPVSTIQCLRNERLGSFWCDSVGPAIYHVLSTFNAEKIGVDYFEDMEVKRWNLLDMYLAEQEEPPFYVYLLCKGLLAIKEYIHKDDACLLGYPNREVEEFLTDRLSSYVTSENKLVAELTEWNGVLSRAMRDQNISTAMQTLQLYGFPILYSKWRRHSTLLDWGVTRRLLVILDAASIKCTEGTRPAVKDGMVDETNGLIDVQTLDLPINYVMKITCHVGVCDIIRDFILFIHNDPDLFRKAIDNQTEVYLVGMSFTNSSREGLENWICLPYRHGELKLDQVQASSPDLVSYILDRYKSA